MLKINLHSNNEQLNIKIEEGSNVKEVLEMIQEKYQIEKQVKHWTCYSLTRNKVLHHSFVFNNPQNEELQVYYEVKDDFSDLQQYKDQKRKEHTLNSQLSTNRHSTHPSDMEFQNNKVIILDGLKQYLEIDGQTTIKELFEYLAKENKIELKEVLSWSCFSESQNKPLTLGEQVGFYENEVLSIKTNKNKTNQLMHAQSCGNLFNQQQQTINSQQFFQSQQSLLNYSQTITLKYTILDNNYERERTALFLNTQKVEDIAQDTLQVTSLTINKVSVDIFINQQQYNNPNRRNMSLEQLKLSKTDKIQAQIRWIN